MIIEVTVDFAGEVQISYEMDWPDGRDLPQEDELIDYDASGFVMPTLTVDCVTHVMEMDGSISTGILLESSRELDKKARAVIADHCRTREVKQG